MKAFTMALRALLTCGAASLIGCTDQGNGNQSPAESLKPAKITKIKVPDAPWPAVIETPNLSSWGDAAALDSKTIEKLMEQGNAGDARSAVIVAAYFANSKSPNRSEADKWTLIAAENGDAPSAVEVAWSLQSQGGKESCLRAKFWLEKAALTQEALPSASGKNELSVEEELGLVTLRDNWQACLDGHGATYLGLPKQVP
jgi:hypothetical protein